ncbi:MAG: methyltransferase [Nevskia sp.]|jgi:predicted methyltransferase|nr:methyltransferase [Nevskia sp.]MCK9384234.1 methyltransferase [Nevskia sp.]
MSNHFVAPALALALLSGVMATSTASAATLEEAIKGPQRTPDYAQRDRYRHPEETLSFFGVKPNMAVVEIWPGSGWYSEILAPYLRDHGKYYVATPAASLPDASPGTKNAVAMLHAKFDAAPTAYDKVTFTEFRPPLRTEIAPAGTADVVLTFRNVHNWIVGGYEQDAFKAFYAALKPGGVLGVVEHRAPEGMDLAGTKKSGYTSAGYVKALAHAAGFTFAGESHVNDNPKDTKDYAEGVWTLPPTLFLKETDREKYLAIGESDRMTLKFVKPKAAK